MIMVVEEEKINVSGITAGSGARQKKCDQSV
jgi:hypothetical protein